MTLFDSCWRIILSCLPPATNDVEVGPVARRGRRVGDRAVLEGEVGDVPPVAAAGKVPVALPPGIGEIFWLAYVFARNLIIWSSIATTGRHIWTETTSPWLRFGRFWQVMSRLCSYCPGRMVQLPKSKSTVGFYHPGASNCIAKRYNSLKVLQICPWLQSDKEKWQKPPVALDLGSCDMLTGQ